MSYQKRVYLRIPTNFDVVIVTNDEKASPAKINNMSLGGLQLLSKVTIPKDSIFLIQFFVPASKNYFELQVKALRVNSLPKSRSGFISVMGVQIIDPPETWEPWVSRWIESRFEKTIQRKIAACFLWVVAIAFVVKVATTALGLKTLNISISDFFGLEFFGLPAAGSIYIFLSLFLASLMLFCGLQTLRPTIRDGFFFSSSAAWIGVGCFSIRLVLKLSFVFNSADQEFFYFLDLALFLSGLAGALLTRYLEDSYKNFKAIIERESIRSLLHPIPHSTRGD